MQYQLFVAWSNYGQCIGYSRYAFIDQEILEPLQLNQTLSPFDTINMDDVMSGYHVGYPHDLKTSGHEMLATASDVGIFLRALNDGSLFEANEREVYASVYEFEHSGWVPGYQSFATYHKDTDMVIVAFYSTTDAKLYNWNISEIVNSRIVKIVKKESD